MIQTNNIENPNLLTAGTEILIPGLEGIQGTLVTESIPLGENLQSLSGKYQISQNQLTRLNRLTSPNEVFAGANLILPKQDQNALSGREVLHTNQSFLEAAALSRSNPWTLFSRNLMTGSWQALSGQVLSFATTGLTSLNESLPFIKSVEIEPAQLSQGKTALVVVKPVEALKLTGSLNGSQLHFFSSNQDQWDALQGIHAMAETGLTPFELFWSTSDGQNFEFEQNLLIAPGSFARDPMLSVDPTTIDPKNTQPENDQVAAITSPISSVRLWQGVFRDPVDEPICLKSRFGTRRAYNGGPYSNFHGGLDYGVCANLNIYAPEAGTVVFTGPLTVRGNATFIDHGWGIYTGYFHQSKILVKTGDIVQKGQLIGQIGDTGRVTGPHLHWEVWANGIQVDPVDWLNKSFPQ